MCHRSRLRVPRRSEDIAPARRISNMQHRRMLIYCSSVIPGSQSWGVVLPSAESTQRGVGCGLHSPCDPDVAHRSHHEYSHGGDSGGGLVSVIQREVTRTKEV